MEDCLYRIINGSVCARRIILVIDEPDLQKFGAFTSHGMKPVAVRIAELKRARCSCGLC